MSSIYRFNTFAFAFALFYTIAMQFITSQYTKGAWKHDLKND